ncbi:hypothetical protein GQ44DRAFT_705324 [Phaeosphaeriaceae sp. PMI808]|nr:hypothetical protein GQ44DRAFT_705324 [Phaeosphaeriaceae sp. PMI808]
MSTETGTKALKGDPETISNTYIFEGVDHARKITGKGKLIQIYDPTKDMSTPPYWEYEDENIVDTKDVPAGYEVRVVKATLQFH